MDVLTRLRELTGAPVNKARAPTADDAAPDPSSSDDPAPAPDDELARLRARVTALECAIGEHLMLSESSDAVPWRMNPDTLCFDYVGPQADRVLGIKNQEWLRPSFLEESLSPEDRSAAIEQFRLVVDFGAAHEAEFRLRRDDGTWVWLRCTIQMLPGAVPPVLTGLFFDVTVRRTLESEARQGQKLEAVGRLASGIAHEINTPIQFVGDSVAFVHDSTKDLWRLIQEYQALAAEHPGELATRIAELEEEIDLEYITQNIPTALERCREGLARVALLVRSMKEFAHPDRKEMSTADLNRALESTIIIARSEYRPVADVETDLGQIPPVKCYLSEINQVFLIIIVNAAHAIGSVVAGTDQRGTIRIATRHNENDVTISISDTGGGIPTQFQERIFDPFFTTKDVGKGTGQGLSIARQVVVDKHGGTLTFETEPGQGTTFHIRIPISPP